VKKKKKKGMREGVNQNPLCREEVVNSEDVFVYDMIMKREPRGTDDPSPQALIHIEIR